jgi:hypothetical protein
MSAPLVTLDFVNRRAPATLAGALLLLLGVSAAAAASTASSRRAVRVSS